MNDKAIYVMLANHHNLKECRVTLHRKGQPSEMYQGRFLICPEDGDLHIGDDAVHHVVYLKHVYVVFVTANPKEVFIVLQER